MKQPVNKQAIGILGGTFDPIHFGHIKPLVEISTQLSLESIALMPAHIPPHKTHTYTELSHRLAMLALVCQQYPIFNLDTRELNRTTPSYTVETLKEMKQENPNATVYFFMGLDSLINLSSWYCWQELFSLCHLIVQTRPNYQLNDVPCDVANELSYRRVDDLLHLSQQTSGAIYFTKHQCVDVSSTQIRAAIAKKLSCQHLLPEPVLRYINQHCLYSS